MRRRDFLAVLGGAAAGSLPPLASYGQPDSRSTPPLVTPETQVIRFRLVGHHEEEFLGVPGSGQPIDVPCIGILKVRDGKVSRLDGIVDIATVLQQIGAL